MRTFGYIGSGILVGGSLLIATSAIAGGFAIREQSTTGLGNAFSDSAAGSDLSSMYWNPAAVTSQDGLNSLSSYTAILPDTTITPTAGVGTSYEDLAVLGASYFNYQINQQLYIGLSINSPLGLVTDSSNNNWAGDRLNRRSEILTLNAAPTVGYKVNKNLSIAAGVQVQYMKVRLEQAAAASGPSAVIKGDDVAVGFTAGVLYKDDSGTSVGVGFRSSIKHKLDGTTHIASGLAPLTDTSANLDTPEMVTVSLRQDLTDSFAIMANYEWSNWSRLAQLRVSPGFGGGVDVVETFAWKDSWFVSVGAEMKLNDKFTARTGLGYEQTPVPAITRNARLPDSDRIWLSLGGSYKWSEATTLDIGYTHLFFEDSNISPANPLIGNAAVENSVDILSLGMRVKW
jgi:long-chain fatty acid transport protein